MVLNEFSRKACRLFERDTVALVGQLMATGNLSSYDLARAKERLGESEGEICAREEAEAGVEGRRGLVPVGMVISVLVMAVIFALVPGFLNLPTALSHTSYERAPARVGIRPSAGAADLPLLVRECPFVSWDTITHGVVNRTRLRILAGPGTLEVRGVEGSDSVHLVARRCASRRDVLDGIRLDIREEGEGVVMEVSIPTELFRAREGTTAKMDLKMTVPRRLQLEIEDGLGDIVLQGVGPIRMWDRLGGLQVVGVWGDLHVRSGPGEVSVSQVRGSVFVETRVGELTIEEVTGNVSLAAEHVGRTVVGDVHGSVMIGDDHTGEIEIRGVGGDLVIGRAEWAAIRYHDVEGEVRIGGTN